MNAESVDVTRCCVRLDCEPPLFDSICCICLHSECSSGGLIVNHFPHSSQCPNPCAHKLCCRQPFDRLFNCHIECCIILSVCFFFQKLLHYKVFLSHFYQLSLAMQFPRGLL